MLRSPLDDRHRALGARMGEFAGWQMPISYAGTVAEHTAVRERVGVFDVSHLGKLMVRGDDARERLDAQLTSRIANLAPWRARYTLICNDDAGILDDLIVYCLAPDECLLVPNAANRDLVAARLAAETLEWATIAVQGPRSPELVAEWFPFAKDLGYMRVARDGDVVVSRSGYTGERGYEVFAPPEQGATIWDALIDAGAEPCGLGARDTLRLEMGYPLHGNDIDPHTTPAEAGLMWAVALEGRLFPGAQALRERVPRKAMVGLRMLDKVIPRHGCAVLRDGAAIGTVTSGTFSPTLKQGIALAHVEPGTTGEVDVDVRGKTGRAQVVDPPFVDRSPK